jgi:hypothetical protein
VPASVTIRSRVDATDLLRGTVMILMAALDHTQDFFSAAGMNPRDVTGPALFTNSRSSSRPFGRGKYTLRSDRERRGLVRRTGVIILAIAICSSGRVLVACSSVS